MEPVEQPIQLGAILERFIPCKFERGQNPDSHPSAERAPEEGRGGREHHQHQAAARWFETALMVLIDGSAVFWVEIGFGSYGSDSQAA